MKRLLGTVLLATLGATGTADAQDCDAVLGELVRTHLQIETAGSKSESLRKWFFSRRFEEKFRNDSSGASVTVPLGLVPITFGGSHQSADAWKLRADESKMTEWRFDEAAWERIVYSALPLQAIEAWKDCLDKRFDHLNLDAHATRDGVTITFGYNDGGLDIEVPALENITASRSIDLNDTSGLIGRELKRQGQTIMARWVPDTYVGTVVLNTSSGSRVLIVRRPGGVVRVDYIVNTTEMRHTSAVSNRSTSENMHNRRANDDCRTGYTSNDGKWCASRRVLEVSLPPQSPAGSELRSPRLRHISGPRTHQRWEQRPAADVTGRSFRAVFVAWTRRVTHELTAEVWSPHSNRDIIPEQVQILGARFVVDPPPGVDADQSTVSLAVGGDLVDFKLGQSDTGRGVHLIEFNPGLNRYTYEIRR